MIRARNAAPAIVNLICRAAIVIFAAALILGMVSETDDDAVRDPRGKRPERVAAGSSEDWVPLVIGFREGQSLSQYVLRDEDGNELMHIMYSRKGDMSLLPGRRFPIRVGSTMKVDGTYSLNLSHRRHIYRLALRSDGSSDVLVSGPASDLIGRLGVTPGGEFVHYNSNPH